MMSHTMKVWERVIESRGDDDDDQRAVVWLHAERAHYRCGACFESVNREGQKEEL